ncbi:hypothetical protein TURU_104548 [Turdus rufiventris]|nr:hypothetical protein TURU_104548 [Turdus rufiventris]
MSCPDSSDSAAFLMENFPAGPGLFAPPGDFGPLRTCHKRDEASLGSFPPYLAHLEPWAEPKSAFRLDSSCAYAVKEESGGKICAERAGLGEPGATSGFLRFPPENPEIPPEPPRFPNFPEPQFPADFTQIRSEVKAERAKNEEGKERKKNPQSSSEPGSSENSDSEAKDGKNRFIKAIFERKKPEFNRISDGKSRI